ncbi:early nodule-specific protein 2-like [Cornus florida]|uniref:early nodule-specific protein 2-like n=1 Tax=Cornus florida TaxID=4283 RepID=UPI00289E4CF5|nr:early nodule-specific protein 2-like [Cornus florida]
MSFDLALVLTPTGGRFASLPRASSSWVLVTSDSSAITSSKQGVTPHDLSSDTNCDGLEPFQAHVNYSYSLSPLQMRTTEKFTKASLHTSLHTKSTELKEFEPAGTSPPPAYIPVYMDSRNLLNLLQEHCKDILCCKHIFMRFGELHPDVNLSKGDEDPEPSRFEPDTKPAPESEPSPQFYDEVNTHHSANIPPSPPSNILPSPPLYRTTSYTSQHFHPPPSSNKSENSTYLQPHHHQPYPQEPQQHLPQNYPSQEPQQHLPQNYPSHEIPSYSYLNFQSYPSFRESNLPAAPSHYPSYHQGSDASYSTSSATQPNYQAAAQYNSGNRNGTVSEAVPTSAQTYQYDSNYQPPAEKMQ